MFNLKFTYITEWTRPSSFKIEIIACTVFGGWAGRSGYDNTVLFTMEEYESQWKIGQNHSLAFGLIYCIYRSLLGKYPYSGCSSSCSSFFLSYSKTSSFQFIYSCYSSFVSSAPKLVRYLELKYPTLFQAKVAHNQLFQTQGHLMNFSWAICTHNILTDYARDTP